jgi:predicted transcriptional regulator
MIAQVPTPKRPPAMAASMNVRMPLELRQRLQDVADAHDVDVSHVARIAIAEGLAGAADAIATAIDRAERGET